MKKLGYCPISSETFLSRSLDALQEGHALDVLDREQLEQDAAFAVSLMPDALFPDCTVDLPLMGGASEGLTLSFDCYERCSLEYQSSGTYFRRLGLSAMNAPENRDDLLLLHVKGESFRAETVDRKKRAGVRLSAREGEAFLRDFPVFQPLSGLPLRAAAEPLGALTRVTVSSGPVYARDRFENKPYKATVLKLLADAGVPAENLRALEKASFNLGIPYYDREHGFGKWISYIDVAGFVFTLRGADIVDCRAEICISDRCIAFEGKLSRRLKSYQWHITDFCDQRCKHCYLFAEDAALHCVSTPWDQLLLTLAQIEEDADQRGSVPNLVLTGGDPILHPDFWRFAEEIHRRGISWAILGNPFHLDEAVCRRLYQLGCVFYQLSLDGLPAWHDYMRKPGSFDATVGAVALLNDAGIRTHLMATVSRQNKEDVLACMEVAIEHHAYNFSFARYCATSREKAAETYMSPEEYRDFLLRWYQKRKQYEEAGCETHFGLKEHLFILLQSELGEFTPAQYYLDHPDVICDGCHLGQHITILPNGDLMACRRMDGSVIGNVKTDSVHNIVTGELCKSYVDIKNIKKCKDCDLLQWCRGCRAVGFNVTGDLQGEDPCCWKHIEENSPERRKRT